MKFLKIFLILAFSLAYTFDVSAQQYSYPNELKGFELFENGKWKALIPFVSTREDVEKIFGQNCHNSCDYDENWRIQIMYVGRVWGYSNKEKKTIQCVSEDLIDKYSSLIFYPKNKIVRNRLKFGKQFGKLRIGESHGNPSISDIYSDDWGLAYSISAENTYDKSFYKGDLVSIHYGYSSSDYEKYESKIQCR